MSKIQIMSEAQVDAHVKSILFEKKTRSAKKKNFCELYKAARPIMGQALGIMKFIKPSWAKALEGIMESLDDACPIATEK